MDVDRHLAERVFVHNHFCPNPVFAPNGEMSDIKLSPSPIKNRLGKPDNAEMSVILFPLRFSRVRAVKPDKGERSDIALLLIKRPST